MIVLDASAAVELVLRLPLGEEVAQRLADPDQAVHAPHLLGIEVVQVVRRYVHRGEIRPQRGDEALGDFADLDVVRHPHEPLLGRMWRLRDNLTACDAAYVALAEALDAPLLTLDAGLAGAPGHEARVELIA